MKHIALADRQRTPHFLQPYLSSFPRQPWRVFLALGAVNALLAGAVVVLELGFGIENWNILRDPNAIAGQPAYYGSFSNLGVLTWAAGAAVALFSWQFLIRNGVTNARLRALRLGGLFCAIACIDDMFMLHEHAYLIGAPESVVLAGYALLLLAFAVSTLPFLHASRWLLLMTALASLAFSVVFDFAHFRGSVLLEETFKLGGASFLAAYLVTLSSSALAGALPAARR